MATIRKKNNKFQVQIRKLGIYKSKTFNNISDAKKWSVNEENKINLGLDFEILDKKIKLSDLLNKYLKEITINKKGYIREHQRINRMLKQPIASKFLINLKTKDFIDYKNIRLLDGKRTCRYDLSILHHVYNVAIKLWNYPIKYNPISNIPLPKCNPPRNRRLKDGELSKLLKRPVRKEIKAIIVLALETGMRRSEILNIKPEDIDENILHINDSKNNCFRKIPLTKHAQNILLKTHVPFRISESSFRQYWSRLLKRNGVYGLHFHDLRHEAISRFFEMGLSIPEVSLISGHKDVRQLMRYTHLKIKNIAKKLV